MSRTPPRVATHTHSCNRVFASGPQKKTIDSRGVGVGAAAAAAHLLLSASPGNSGYSFSVVSPPSAMVLEGVRERGLHVRDAARSDASTPSCVRIALHQSFESLPRSALSPQIPARNAIFHVSSPLPEHNMTRVSLLALPLALLLLAGTAFAASRPLLRTANVGAGTSTSIDATTATKAAAAPDPSPQLGPSKDLIVNLPGYGAPPTPQYSGFLDAGAAEPGTK